MAFAHDSVRVLQCFIQFGSHEQRQETFEELKGEQKFAFFICCFLNRLFMCVCLSVSPMLYTRECSSWQLCKHRCVELLSYFQLI